LQGLSEAQRRAYILADNRLAQNAGWDNDLLTLELTELDNADFDLSLLGFEPGELAGLLEDEPGELGDNKLADKFLIPPFSVLNAREGWWQERKKQWLSLGIKSEEGRDNDLLKSLNNLAKKSSQGEQSNNSVFDPVLAELAYRWFSPHGGIVLDPFAGGSVRGIVASKTGRQYIGCELREEQVEANREQAGHICDDLLPVWHTADSRRIDSVCEGVQADFILSCPPYADLEVYSDDPADISTLPYDEFLKSYKDIIEKSCSLLKPDSFACFVVGEVRDKKGNYYNFVGDTVTAFLAAGLSYYNEAILLTPIGAKALTAGKGMSATRKLGKIHQNVLVFVKGDAKKATERCGQVDVAIPEGLDANSSA
jgi:hypothetical protein